MSASPRAPLLPSRSEVQVALAIVLVGERTLSAAALEPRCATYALVLFGVGLWFASPGRGGGRALRWGRTIVEAALLAGLGCLWRWVFGDVLAPRLSPFLSDVGPWLLLLGVLGLDGHALVRVLRLAGIELVKLGSSRLVRVGLLVSAGLTALAGLVHERLPSETPWTLAASMAGAGFAAAQVFVLVLGAIAIAGEASQGTLKMILPHAYRRSDWVLAKGLALLGVTLVYAVAVSAVALGGARLAGPLEDVTLTAEGFGGEPLVTVHAAGALMRAHVADMLWTQTAALAATGALGLLLSSALNGVVGALCSAFLAFAALRLGDLLLALDHDTLRRLFPWGPERLREVVTKLGRGLSEAWDERLPAISLLLAAASAGVLLLASVRVFARRDLHV